MANDRFMTPIELAKFCIDQVPFDKKDSFLDPARGDGAFYNQLPADKDWCEIDQHKDFLLNYHVYDWIISNPPYSNLDEWLKRSFNSAEKGVAYLLGVNNLTAKRLQMAEDLGFGVTKISMFKVFKWWGMSYFIVWERGKPSILQFNRKVWR